MKNQHTGRRSYLRAAGVALLSLALLALCIGGLALVSFAEEAPDGLIQEVTFDDATGISYNSEGKYWEKIYDGAATIDAECITLSVAGETQDRVAVVKSASFVDTNTLDARSAAGVARIHIVYEWDGLEIDYILPAQISKRALTWDGVALGVHFVYDPEANTYSHTFSEEELANVKLSSLNGIVEGDEENLVLGSVANISVSASELAEALLSKTSVRLYTTPVLSGDAASNYYLESIAIEVTAEPCRITEVVWQLDGVTAEEAFVFSYGDANAYRISALGKIGTDSYRELTVKVKGVDVTLMQAKPNEYGAVSESPYVLYAESEDSALFVLDGTFETSVTFNRAECVISVADAVFKQDAESNAEFYYLPIRDLNGNIPAEVFAGIGYKYTADGVNFVNAPSEPGVYTVQFFLRPEDEASYTLKVEENGENADGVITATLLPYRILAGIEEGGADVIVHNEKNDLLGISASVVPAENIPETLLKYFSVSRGITLCLKGTEATDSFRLILPVHSELFSDPNTFPLTVADLYVFDGEKLKPAKDVYTVTLSEDGAYYTVSGVAARGTEMTLTLLMAPEYNVPFWATALGVSIIVFLILLAVVLLAILGLYLRRKEKNGKNPVLTVDTEGEASKVGAATVPEKLGGVDDCIEEGLDALTEEMEETTEAEVPAEEPADATEETAETMGATLTEVAALSLQDDSEQRAIEDAEKLTEAMAEEKVREFMMNTEPSSSRDTEEDYALVDRTVEEALNETVEAAMAESDSVETLAEVSENALSQAFRQTVDAIVVEVLATAVRLPEGIREIDPVNSEDKGDLYTQAKHSVEDAMRAICSEGGVPSLNDGMNPEALARAVSEAVASCTPDDWDAVLRASVTDALTELLTAKLFK